MRDTIHTFFVTSITIQLDPKANISANVISQGSNEIGSTKLNKYNQTTALTSISTNVTNIDTHATQKGETMSDSVSNVIESYSLAKLNITLPIPEECPNKMTPEDIYKKAEAIYWYHGFDAGESIEFYQEQLTELSKRTCLKVKPLPPKPDRFKTAEELAEEKAVREAARAEAERIEKENGLKHRKEYSEYLDRLSWEDWKNARPGCEKFKWCHEEWERDRNKFKSEMARADGAISSGLMQWEIEHKKRLEERDKSVHMLHDHHEENWENLRVMAEISYQKKLELRAKTLEIDNTDDKIVSNQDEVTISGGILSQNDSMLN